MLKIKLGKIILFKNQVIKKEKKNWFGAISGPF
jgi:hypothetical protein